MGTEFDKILKKIMSDAEISRKKFDQLENDFSTYKTSVDIIKNTPVIMANEPNNNYEKLMNSFEKLNIDTKHELNQTSNSFLEVLLLKNKKIQGFILF